MDKHPITRTCPYCGDELVRNVDEPEWNWENREYCNKTHAAKHSNEQRRPRRYK